MTAIPTLEYEADLFYERTIRTVTANTRADGDRVPGRSGADPGPAGHDEFPLDVANQALELLKQGAIAGSGVLLTDERFRV